MGSSVQSRELYPFLPAAVAVWMQRLTVSRRGISAAVADVPGPERRTT
jgi:hypothetical protein